MLTARSTDEDKLLGLDIGADEYLTKPFNPRSGQPACVRPRRAAPRVASPRTRGSAISSSALSDTKYSCKVAP